MRVYREPDAFPSNSHWLREAISNNGAPVSVPELESRSDNWRPWRAYAAMHLWDSFFADKSGDGGPWDRESAPPLASQVA
jgi:AraC family transcriptional regulator of adaptative response / DNA-3-methyladenine glycosylase II